ncbi:MAG: HepT-like ribonuclease domain-containing protein [Prochlorococcaceae cyanobacterium]
MNKDRHYLESISDCLEVIGEATKNLSRELREANPGIPWRQIAGMRDVLIHDYLKVNLARVP